MREREGYFSWTNPETGREYGLGRNRAKAIKEVIAAEIHIASRNLSLVERISGAATTWKDWCDEFAKILSTRKARPNTIRTRKSLMKRLRSIADEQAAASRVSTIDCAKALDQLTDQGKHRMAQAFRSFMKDCFDRMIAKGWRTDNPANVTDSITVEIQRARLPFDAFMKVYETTDVVWLRNAMALALVAGKDRDSVRNAKFTDFRDGGW